MAEIYRDPWITCTDDALRIRGYYFPWGTKTIPYTSIRSVERVPLSAAGGQFRIWGTASVTRWASLDPQRMRKKEALVLDVGRRVQPFITPRDAAEVEAVIHAHTA